MGGLVAQGILVVRDVPTGSDRFSVRAAGTSFDTALGCLLDHVILYRPRDADPGQYVGTGRLEDIVTHRSSGTLTLHVQ